jgi:hypothetical protein
MVTKLGAVLEAFGAGVEDVRIIDGRTGDYVNARGTKLARTPVAARE